MCFTLTVMFAISLHTLVKSHQLPPLKTVNCIICKVYFIHYNNTKDIIRQCLIYHQKIGTKESHNDQNVEYILSNEVILKRMRSPESRID